MRDMWSIFLFLLGGIVLDVYAQPWFPSYIMNRGPMNAANMGMMTNMNANIGFANMNGMAMSNGNAASGPPTAVPNPNNAELMDEAAEAAADAKALQQAQAAKKAAALNATTTANAANNTGTVSANNTSSTNSSNSTAQSVPNFGMGVSMVPRIMFVQRGGRMVPVYMGVRRMMTGNNVNMAHSGSRFGNTMSNMMVMNRQLRMRIPGSASRTSPMRMNAANVRMHSVNNMSTRMNPGVNAQVSNNARSHSAPNAINAGAMNAARSASSRTNAMNVAYMNALRNMANQMANIGMGNTRVKTPMRSNTSTRFMRNSRNRASTSMNVGIQDFMYMGRG